jgi:hypothetical protein
MPKNGIMMIALKATADNDPPTYESLGWRKEGLNG